MNTEPIDLTKLPEPRPLDRNSDFNYHLTQMWQEEYDRLLPWMQAAQAENERLREFVELIRTDTTDYLLDYLSASDAVASIIERMYKSVTDGVIPSAAALNPTQDA